MRARRQCFVVVVAIVDRSFFSGTIEQRPLGQLQQSTQSPEPHVHKLEKQSPQLRHGASSSSFLLGVQSVGSPRPGSRPLGGAHSLGQFARVYSVLSSVTRSSRFTSRVTSSIDRVSSTTISSQPQKICEVPSCDPKGRRTMKLCSPILVPRFMRTPSLIGCKPTWKSTSPLGLNFSQTRVGQETIRLAREADLFGAQNERFHYVSRVVVSVRSRSLSRSLLAGSALSRGVLPMRPMRRSSRPTRSQ